MAPSAAFKLERIIKNSSDIVAIELICAWQGREFNPQYALAKNSEAIYQKIREHVPVIEQDTQLSGYIESISHLVRSGQIDEIVQSNIQDMK